MCEINRNGGHRKQIQIYNGKLNQPYNKRALGRKVN